MEKRTWKNTFALNCENEELTLDMIISGLFLGAWGYDELPEDAQKAVDEEMDRKFPENI